MVQQRLVNRLANDQDTINDEIEGEVLAAVHKALQQIPSESRKVLELIYFNKKKYKEVAGILNISVETVKSQRSYGIKKLRELLGDRQLYLVWMVFI